MPTSLRRRSAGGRAAATLAYLLAVFAFFELTSRAALSIPSVFKRVAGSAAAAWRLQWVRRERPKGGSYSFDVYHPTRGWALRPNLRHWPVFDNKFLSSNSKGLRGRAEHEYEKPRGVTRALVFGDSFTFGEDVSDDDTYAAWLQKLHGPNLEVLNFGVHGYGHDQMLVYLQEEGIRYHPDIVILGFVDWDMERNLLDFRDYAKPRFDLGRDGLTLRNTPVPRPQDVLAAERYHSRFLDLLSIVGAGVRRRLGWEQAAAERLTAALLDAFRRTTEAAGAELVVAYLPVEEEIESASVAPEGERFITGYCRERGVACIDVRPAFVRRESEGDHLRVRGHWNRREHRLAADAIEARLEALRPGRPSGP